MPHYAVLMHRNADLARSFSLRADAWRDDGERTVFVRDDAVAHQLPTAMVGAIEVFETAKGAADRVAEHRRSLASGATMHVQEGAAAAPRGRGSAKLGTGVPAEGLTVRIEER